MERSFWHLISYLIKFGEPPLIAKKPAPLVASAGCAFVSHD
jgi:hypothetical protein